MLSVFRPCRRVHVTESISLRPLQDVGVAFSHLNNAPSNNTPATPIVIEQRTSTWTLTSTSTSTSTSTLQHVEYRFEITLISPNDPPELRRMCNGRSRALDPLSCAAAVSLQLSRCIAPAPMPHRSANTWTGPASPTTSSSPFLLPLPCACVCSADTVPVSYTHLTLPTIYSV